MRHPIAFNQGIFLSSSHKPGSGALIFHGKVGTEADEWEC